ncbi:MAG: ABC transporter substrate-binding protein [Chloroflexi bacterium]|nr:MAG: ABC transporter substrate-binding protein [Chloroflexota bacterium]
MPKQVIAAVVLLLLLVQVTPTTAQTQPDEIVCKRDVIVQIDDWLSKLSDKFYGDVLAFPAIFEATNAKAKIDDSYATIDDVDLIEPGWKLCIVGVEQAQEIVGFEFDNPPLLDDTPLNLTGAIKIGAVQALTGPLASQGKSIQSGIELAVQEINQTQLLGNGTLEIIWEDSRGSSEQAAAAFRKLIEQEQVAAILGPTLSQSAFAADPLAQAAGVPVIGTSNVAEGIADIGDYIFRTSLPESTVISNTVRRTTELLNLQNVVIVFDRGNSFSTLSMAQFSQALAASGVEILATVPFTTGAADFSGQFSALETLSPDAIILVALSEDAANIIAQARQAGVSDDVQFIGANSFNSDNFLRVGGQAVDGVFSGAAWNIGGESTSNRNFVAAYQAEYGRPPDELAAQAYSAVWVLAWALRGADATDGALVRDSLARLSPVETPLGLLNFAKNGDPNHVPVLQVVEDGTFKLLP